VDTTGAVSAAFLDETVGLVFFVRFGILCCFCSWKLDFELELQYYSLGGNKACSNVMWSFFAELGRVIGDA
jgi:hypothetical protein